MGLFGLQARVLAAFTFTAEYPGSGGTPASANVISVIKVTNYGATSSTFTWSRGGAIATSVGGNYDYTLTHGLPQNGTNAAPSLLKSTYQSEAYTFTVAGGATVVVPVRITYTCPIFAGTGAERTALLATSPLTKNFSLAVPYYESGVAKSATLSMNAVTVTLTGTASATAWSYTGADHATYSGSEYPLWGTIYLNLPVPSGTITATGATLDLNGGGRVQIHIGTGFSAMTLVAQQQITGGTPGASIPNAVYSTATPAADVGKLYRISLNGTILKEGTITLDPITSSFAITHNMAAQQMEGIVQPFIDDGQGIPLPVNEDDGLDETPDPDHVRPDPGNVNDLGPDAKTDTTSGWTVKGEYRAVRSAIEDSMTMDHNPKFDFASWAHKGSEASSSEGKGLGSAIGSGFASMGGMVGSYPMNGASGGSAQILMHNGHGSTIGAIVAPSWSSGVRSFLLTLLTILFFIVEFSIIRSGFAGR